MGSSRITTIPQFDRIRRATEAAEADYLPDDTETNDITTPQLPQRIPCRKRNCGHKITFGIHYEEEEYTKSFSKSAKVSVLVMQEK